MDDVVNRLARELADAIAAAVAENPQVEACREKARAAGFEMKVTLEAVVGFVSRSQSTAMTKVTTPVRAGRANPGASGNEGQPRRNFDVTANDRRFLRSLRIAADEMTEPVE
jgi:4-hydroxy-3-methylbut-2-en-1-yl diphosphate synthase IspG/GcpE